MKVRTRYAPSPTGFMHVGNLRTAIFEYLVAKQNNGDFILRIEDTDQTRKVEGAVSFIYDTLNLCNMEISEGPLNGGNCGPYFQSERLDLYKKYAHELVENKKAYYCFCSEERLENLRKVALEDKVPFKYDGLCKKLTEEEIALKLENKEPYVIRQAMPKSGVSTYEDLVYGKIEVENKILEDQILLKSDSYPTYNFANVIDDHLMGITHVIRGNEYLMSTPKYNLLYDAFGFEKPIYIHLPMVLGEDGTKLSKRNGDASFMDLYNEGYLPDAIINYLVLLGWSPSNNEEIFSMEELIKNFDPKRISKSPATFDIKKLRWINAHYIKKMDIDNLVEKAIPYLKEEYNLDNVDNLWLKHLLTIYQDSLSYIKEIVILTEMFFKEEVKITNEAQNFIKELDIKNVIDILKEEITSIKDFTVANIKNAIMSTKDKSGVNGKNLYMPIRIKISGQMHGPELADTIFLLGKERVLNRLK